MNTYEVTGVSRRTVQIEAESEEEAVDKYKEQFPQYVISEVYLATRDK